VCDCLGRRGEWRERGRRRRALHHDHDQASHHHDDDQAYDHDDQAYDHDDQAHHDDEHDLSARGGPRRPARRWVRRAQAHHHHNDQGSLTAAGGPRCWAARG
jgi:hypothetical protein